jgi:hypothetical protein
MRIRTVKPELFTHSVVSSWPRDVRWTLPGLYCYLDDHGRGVDDVRLVRAALYPLDEQMTTRRVEQHLALMAVNDTPLCRYDADDGTNLMHIVEWAVKGSPFFQLVNRRAKSLLQPCPKHEPETLFQ